MKISELQNILEHYKQENGDLEVRITAETHFNEQHEILDHDAIDINVVYDETEFNPHCRTLRVKSKIMSTRF